MKEAVTARISHPLAKVTAMEAVPTFAARGTVLTFDARLMTAMEADPTFVAMGTAEARETDPTFAARGTAEAMETVPTFVARLMVAREIVLIFAARLMTARVVIEEGLDLTAMATMSVPGRNCKDAMP